MNDQDNPYAPPRSEIADLSSNQPAERIIPAGKWVRFFNMLIDMFFYMILSAIIGAALGFISVLIWGEDATIWWDNYANSPNVARDYAFGIAVTLLYYVPFEYLTGRTPAKWITGSRVVNEEGGKPTFGQIIGRTFARFIPFEAFSFLGPTGRGWHDTLPKVYVIRTR